MVMGRVMVSVRVRGTHYHEETRSALAHITQRLIGCSITRYRLNGTVSVWFWGTVRFRARVRARARARFRLRVRIRVRVRAGVTASLGITPAIRVWYMGV